MIFQNDIATRTGLCIFFFILVAGSFASDIQVADSTSRECAKACNQLHFKLAAECKSLCGRTVHHLTVEACVADRPTTLDEMRECFNAKSDASMPADAASFITGTASAILRTVPLPSKVRDAISSASNFLVGGMDALSEKLGSYERALSRTVGYTTGDRCVEASYPVFPAFMHLFNPRNPSWRLGTSQSVFFCKEAHCDGKDVVVGHGARYRASGVLLVRGATCEWPLDSRAPNLGLLMSLDCKIQGHIYVDPSNDFCMLSAKHVLDQSSLVVYRKDGASVVESVDSHPMTTHRRFDLAHTMGCQQGNNLPSRCTLHTYARGFGLELIDFEISVHHGSDFAFGRPNAVLISGMSGSPCIGPKGTAILVLTAVVNGGAELSWLGAVT